MRGARRRLAFSLSEGLHLRPLSDLSTGALHERLISERVSQRLPPNRRDRSLTPSLDRPLVRSCGQTERDLTNYFRGRRVVWSHDQITSQSPSA